MKEVSDADNFALMTVTTPDFVTGTETMIASFLHQNPWFSGDIRIIHSGLNAAQIYALGRLYPRLQVVPISMALREAIASGAHKERNSVVQFASAEAFAQTTYSKVLFCDSDMIFAGDVSELFTQTAELIVTPDGPTLRGNARSLETFEEAKDGTLRNCFSAGLMVLGRTLRDGVVYRTILHHIKSSFWETAQTSHTDQATFNYVLQGRQKLVGPEFNYVLGHAKDVGDLSVPVKVFHFNGRRKPWVNDHVEKLVSGGDIAKKATRLWHEMAALVPDPAAHKQVARGSKFYLDRTIKTHLFLLCPNNSGSTFLSKALATSPDVWSLYREGQHVLGFQGPATRNEDGLIWASAPEKLAKYQDTARFDWDKTKQAWYFQAQAIQDHASVFMTKAPPFIAYADQLVEAFRNVQFMVMVRNPYAMIEGIIRRRARREADLSTLIEMAARHVVACFQMQQKNRNLFANKSLFFTYEEMCANPKETAARIAEFVPDISELLLDQTLEIKGSYVDRLRNMNADQLDRLSPEILKAINQIFAPQQKLFASFGYSLIGTAS